jgi:hypothetical protein
MPVLSAGTRWNNNGNSNNPRRRSTKLSDKYSSVGFHIFNSLQTWQEFSGLLVFGL